MSAPCKDCPDRHLGCHSMCEKYKKFAEERTKYLEMIQKEKKVDNDWWRITGTAFRRRKR